MSPDTSEIDLLRAALQTASRPAIAWAPDGSVIACTATFSALVEAPADSVARLRREEVVHPDDLAMLERHLAEPRDSDLAAPAVRLRLMTRPGGVVRTLSRLLPLVVGGEAVGDLLECVEVGDSLDLREALDDQAATYQLLFEQISEAVYSIDSRGRMDSANRSAERLFGRTLQELRRTPVTEVLVDEGDIRGIQELRERFDAGDRVPRRLAFAIKRPDGEMRWVEASLLMHRDIHGAFSGAFIVARDVTQSKERERELTESAATARQAALVDPLTGLPNRRAFDEAMIVCREDANRGGHPVLIVVDVDQLKSINDQRGHAAGDEAIRATARAISDRIREGDQAFRIGGDEFAIVLQGGSPDAIQARLLAAIPIEGGIPLQISVGSAVCGIDGDDPSEVFRVADRRMYAMKQARRSAR